MEFICPACSTRLVVNGERIRGKRVGFVCKACGTSVEVDGRSDPPGIQARERRVRSPRTSSPALAVELPSPLAPIGVASPLPPLPKPRRATPPPLPRRAATSSAPAQTAEPRPSFDVASERPEPPSYGPTSEPSLPLGMSSVPPVELPLHANREARPSTPPLVSAGVLEATEQARRRRLQTWLSASGLIAALLGGYGIGVLTAAPAPKPALAEATPPPVPVPAASPSPSFAPVAPLGAAAAAAAVEPPAVEPSSAAVISIDDLPIAKRSRPRSKKGQPRLRPLSAKLGEIDKEALVGAMQDADRAAAACSTPGGPRGTSRIALTVAPDGRVANSVLEGGAIFGSVEARCIEEKFRAVRVPAFQGRSVTVHKTVRLR